jgi:hypothetical protein
MIQQHDAAGLYCHFPHHWVVLKNTSFLGGCSRAKRAAPVGTVRLRLNGLLGSGLLFRGSLRQKIKSPISSERKTKKTTVQDCRKCLAHEIHWQSCR